MIDEEQAKAVFAEVPFVKWMGFQTVRIGKEEATLRCLNRPEFRNLTTVQGGVLAVLMDGCAAALLIRHVGNATDFAAVECKVNFLRPVGDRDMVGTARLVKIGRTLAFLEARVEAGGELVANGSFTFMRFDTKKG